RGAPARDTPRRGCDARVRRQRRTLARRAAAVIRRPPLRRRARLPGSCDPVYTPGMTLDRKARKARKEDDRPQSTAKTAKKTIDGKSWKRKKEDDRPQRTQR